MSLENPELVAGARAEPIAAEAEFVLAAPWPAPARSSGAGVPRVTSLPTG